jgi:hypothetical protein
MVCRFGTARSLRVSLGKMQDASNTRTSYELCLVRLECSDEMPLYVFWQLERSEPARVRRLPDDMTSNDSPGPLSLPALARSFHRSDDVRHRNRLGYPQRAYTLTRLLGLVPDPDLR